MLKLRLKRCGRKSDPCYKIVAVNSSAKRDGKALEEFGIYKPSTSKNLFFYTREKEEAFLKRIHQGAKLTLTVTRIWLNFAVDHYYIKDNKV